MTKEQIKDSLFILFETWHEGETAALYPDGSINFYEHDVSRFLHAVEALVVKRVPTPDMDPF